MPHLKEVNISGPSTVNAKNEDSFQTRVSATIAFSDLERSIGLSYKVRVGLYEIDETMDVYTVFPNLKMELKVLVVAVPKTATAMKWSGTKRVSMSFS